MKVVTTRLTATFNLGIVTGQMMTLKSIRYAYSRSTVIALIHIPLRGIRFFFSVKHDVTSGNKHHLI